MMPNDIENEIVFGNEGYVLRWDDDCLSVQITDYHVQALNIPWSTVLEIAEKAGKKRAFQMKGNLPR